MELSELLGIPLTEDLGCYLGHQLLHKGRNSSKQGDIIDRVRGKLEGWKSRCLSRAGRLTLAKTVLSSMAVFYMQAQRLSTQIHKEIDSVIRQCIWGSSVMKQTIHLLNWDTLCEPKDCGDAGLRRSEDMNKSLLAKFGWGVLTCADQTWCQVIRGKYGIDNGKPLRCKHRQPESHIWKGLLWGAKLLSEGLRWKVRNGKGVLF